MLRNSISQSKLSGLELLLALAALILLVQLSPSIWDGLIRAMDLRNWSALTWFVVNLLVVFSLFGIRCAPEFQSLWRERKIHLTEQQQRFEVEKIRTKKIRRIRERREAAERMRVSRSRRIY